MLPVRTFAAYDLLIVLLMTAGVMNAVLRPGPDSSITLFLVLLPIAISASLVKSRRFRLNFLTGASSLALYTAIIVLLSPYQGDRATTVIFFAHYLNIIFLFMIFNVYYRKGRIFILNRLLKSIFLFLVGCAAIAILTGINMPNIPPRDGVIRFIYTNENSFSLAMFSASMYMVIKSDNFAVRVFVAVVALSTATYNSSYIIVASSAFLVPLVVKFDRTIRYRTLGIAASVVGGASMLMLLFPPKGFSALQQAVETVSIHVGDALIRVITFSPYNYQYGSIFHRVDASIGALRAFFNSGLLGVGPGHTTFMMAGPEFSYANNIYSVHNFLLQGLAEYGVVFIACLMALLRGAQPGRIRYSIAVLLFASSVESGAIFTNYVFFYALFALNHMSRDRIEHDKKH